MARFGVREISNVVFKEIDTKKPVLYLESLKTSSTEVTAEANYVQGGPGNPRRLMFEGNKQINYSMQDSLISPESLAMLAGTTAIARSVQVHKKEVLELDDSMQATLAEVPSIKAEYPMFVFITQGGDDIGITVPSDITSGYQLTEQVIKFNGSIDDHTFAEGDKVIVDYYYTSETTAKEIIIEANKFPGYYLLEADTLWRRESDGKDLPARFIMPKVKIASSFTISNAAEGDPSVFDFMVECFPDDNNQMVIINIIE